MGNSPIKCDLFMKKLVIFFKVEKGYIMWHQFLLGKGADVLKISLFSSIDL